MAVASNLDFFEGRSTHAEADRLDYSSAGYANMEAIKLKVTGYHAHLRAGRNGCLKKTLVASRLLVWLNIALHIQLEHRLHFVFSKNGG